MEGLLEHKTLSELTNRFGSPLNVQSTAPFRENVRKLSQVASDREIEFKVYFARKANKCLSFVDAAREIGCGVDTASPVELNQVLEAGLPAEDIISTAAVKEGPLFEQCIESGVVCVIDNWDELDQFAKVSQAHSKQGNFAIRLAGFEGPKGTLHSRFGFASDKAKLVARKGEELGLCLKGLHFHLDGYRQEDRVIALKQTLKLSDDLKSEGFQIDFIDMGGGLPMSYLDSKEQWNDFWETFKAEVVKGKSKMTRDDFSFGLSVIDGEVYGTPRVYPAYQELVQEEWFAGVLDAQFSDEFTIAEELKRQEIQLRCEPGRSVMDGCGFTVAKVVSRKEDTRGDHLVALGLNRTQCRTSHLEFMIDPLLVTKAEGEEGFEAYLTGAYCMESEFIFQRKLKLPRKPELGDFVVIPNTAGYFMHFMESQSHQFPLAKNIFVDGEPVLDAIDRMKESNSV